MMIKKIQRLCLVLFPSLLSQQIQSQTYCNLPGRAPYATVQPGIIRFSLNKVVRFSYNVEDLGSVVVSTGITDSLVRQQTYTVTIRHTRDSINFPNGTNNIRVYIDYNQDWDFTDPGETVISKNYLVAGVFSGTFTIPASAATGITGMRVTAKMSQDVGHTAPTPCDIPLDPLGYHGEIEDYWINIAQEPNLLGLEKSDSKLELTLYPNPVSGPLYLQNIESGANFRADFFDLNGNLILSENFAADSNNNALLDLSGINTGVYFLRLSGAEKTGFHKLFVQH